MSSAAEAMLRSEVEETERAARYMERQLRKFLAGALCAECGEPLGGTHGDGDIVQDDDERTLHKECLADHED